MKEQTSIPKGKIGRAAALVNAGAKIGVNYTRYRAKRLVTGKDDRESLHRANASDSYGALSRLKGGPLKIAQMLSIDTALLPTAYATEFSKAHYQAPPLSYPLVERTFRREFGRSPLEIFDEFSREAVSGASIGQVHKAVKDGREFAVKVQYPGVAASLENDLRLVRPFAMRLFQLSAAEIDPYLEEVKARLIEETDYEMEWRRGTDLAERTLGSVPVRIPRYFPEYSTRRILTMEWVEGVPLDRFIETDPAPELRNRIGQHLWDFYHHQVHALRAFHADPHPGNFFVKDGELWVLDFGCVKEIPDDFHEAYFRLLEPGVATDPALLEKSLRNLDLVLDSDSERAREVLMAMFRESVQLLSRPFVEGEFDFGDPGYLEEVREFGERTGNDPEIRKVGSGRGSAHGLYVNRAYFGLYSLMGMLGARIRTTRPVLGGGENGYLGFIPTETVS
ncbi:ABC1 kinase family protein [Puniceicoccus vermicola]|uniref:AarF/ABC1/UbiB kinase family protein n=1 Tax=Puniceicoccus vermicola TaxID=388746 RepID=A0A7X1AXQ3_9BACT|nr:AarF/ABC1/UbiB kinase family protein [Puniceicoccus vermicola]MBC2600898.1 AarF/ABC1/UbiB kinase family protein [Puniceicoccus vermicola]